MDDTETPDIIALETPPEDVFIPPSIHQQDLLLGASYTHHSPVPSAIVSAPSTECVLGIDEAGRGPVLGPMVYSTLYLPLALSDPLLRATHRFDDSKVLTPAVRSTLLRKICTPGSDLHASVGWAARVMSARDISAGMQRPGPAAARYNLNAQAMDATAQLIRETLARGVNVREIYIDTIGNPASYQARLARIFPAVKIVVEKKADSLYPCVSAASVCAKVTRDAALELLWRELHAGNGSTAAASAGDGWGSGYPSDGRCTGWMKGAMDPLFGWGSECRFSWGTAKDLLDSKALGAVKAEWPVEKEDEDDADMSIVKMTDFYRGAGAGAGSGEDDKGGLVGWFGRPVAEAAL